MAIWHRPLFTSSAKPANVQAPGKLQRLNDNSPDLKSDHTDAPLGDAGRVVFAGNRKGSIREIREIGVIVVPPFEP